MLFQNIRLMTKLYIIYILNYRLYFSCKMAKITQNFKLHYQLHSKMKNSDQKSNTFNLEIRV